jgi:hypothetical protein
MSPENVTVNTLLKRLWIAPENAEWTPRIDILPLNDLEQWMDSEDIEVLGFTNAMIHDGRFRIDPPLQVADYALWIKRYYGRCFVEDPDGKWSDSSYSAGWDLVGVFIALWDDNSVPRELLRDLKGWIGGLYKSGDDRLRTCIVNATLEHLFERKPIRKYFSEWRNDPMLAAAYNEACLWGAKTPLSR